MYRLLTGCIVVFWVVMMTILIRQELLPGLASYHQGQYRTLLQSSRINETEVMGIYFQGKRVGRTETSYFPDGDHYVVYNRTDVELSILEQQTRIHLVAEAYINQSYNLEGFRCKLDSDVFKTQAEGKIEGEAFVVAITNPTGVVTERRFTLGEDAMISNGLSSYLTARDLKVGKRWSVKYLNPLNMRTTEVTATITGRAGMMWKGEKIETYVIHFEHGPLKATAWVDEDGRLIKERTSILGITLIREQAS